MQLAQSLQQIQPSYIREILQTASQPDIISLAGGLPSPDQFPMHLMAPALQKLSTQSSLFQYANTTGHGPLLEFLRNLYRVPPEHSGLVSTGSQQGLDLIARAFINSGDYIALEAPSYLGALQVFGLAQAQIQSVQQNQDGPDLNQLSDLFSSKKVKVFYGVPDFHNPTGVCWSLQTRQQVAHLCQQYDVLFVEDIPYRELRFNGEHLPLVSSFCPEHSLTLRSFSKIATPGIRLGFVSGKTIWMKSLIKIKQAADLHSSMPMQAVLLALLQHEGFKAHLTKTTRLYQERYHCLREQLVASLPAIYNINAVQGGMFLWLTMPEHDLKAVTRAALINGVAVAPSSVFYQASHKPTSALRLNFTHVDEAQLIKAAARLVTILTDRDELI